MIAVRRDSGDGPVGRSGRPPARQRVIQVLSWAALVPAMLILRPYGGLLQDARIYIGQGLAARDPAGLGRDILFANDGQTQFSVMRQVVRVLLDVMSPGSVAMVLAAAGLAVWSAALMALARRVAPGRAALVVAVGILALPAGYGAFDAFSYAEAIATPRIFAEAAVLAALAAAFDRRRCLALLLLAAAVALHPLMALPGLALVALVLIGDDRRWLWPLAVVLAGVLAGAAFGLPLVHRLFERFDPAWLAILRGRSTNLFPTLWTSEAFGRIACRVSAVLVAADLCSGRMRTFFRAAVVVGLGGVAVSLVFGDLVPSVLIAQLQPWRSLWLLAVFGNAGFALSVLRLWRAEDGGRIVLAALVLAWCCDASPELSIPLAAAAVWLHLQARRGKLVALPRRVSTLALASAVTVVIFMLLAEGAALASLLGAGEEARPWPYVVASGVLAPPFVAGVVALVSWRGLRRATVLPGAAAGLVLLCLAASVVWDSRNGERRMMDARDGAAALALALGAGAGDILWIDEDSEAWFLARRPAFFDALQGAPILFSRDLAVEWADRGRMLSGLGLVDPHDIAPWTAYGGAGEVAVSPAALTAFCADRRRPAALVAPGDRLDRVPEGWTASLWRPTVPVMRLSAGEAGLKWRSIDAYTVVRCPDPASR